MVVALYRAAGSQMLAQQVCGRPIVLHGPARAVGGCFYRMKYPLQRSAGPVHFFADTEANVHFSLESIPALIYSITPLRVNSNILDTILKMQNTNATFSFMLIIYLLYLVSL